MLTDGIECSGLSNEEQEHNRYENTECRGHNSVTDTQCLEDEQYNKLIMFQYKQCLNRRCGLSQALGTCGSRSPIYITLFQRVIEHPTIELFSSLSTTVYIIECDIALKL